MKAISRLRSVVGSEQQRRRHLRRRTMGSAVVAATTLVGASLTGLVTPAQAAATFTLSSLSAQVNGTSVTASALVKASSTTAASQFGVCVRTTSRANADFTLNSNVTIWTSGSSYTKTKTFSNGTYTYYACLKSGSTWYIVGSKKTFVVGGASANMPVGISPDGSRSLPRTSKLTSLAAALPPITGSTITRAITTPQGAVTTTPRRCCQSPMEPWTGICTLLTASTTSPPWCPAFRLLAGVRNTGATPCASRAT